MNNSTIALKGPDASRTKAILKSLTKTEARKRASEIIGNISTKHPILLVNELENEKEAVVYTPGERDEVSRYTPTDANYDKFEGGYADVEFSDRDYYLIQTNSLTGLTKTEIQRGSDNVIEMTDYKNLSNTPFDSRLCPSCSGYRPRTRGIHRVILRGEEKLIPYHSKNSCETLMGELNADLIDTKAFDLPVKEEASKPHEQVTLDECIPIGN